MLALAVTAAILSIPAVQDPLRLEVGQTIVGRIEDSDPVVETETLKKGLADVPVRGRRYAFETPTPGAYTIELRSYSFDAYLVLRDGSGKVVEENDDGWIYTHSRIVFEATASSKSWSVDACALHGKRGPYELKLVPGKPEVLSARDRQRAEIEDAREALRVVEVEKGSESPVTARNMNRLASLLQASGSYAEARPLLERVLAIREKALGPENPTTATTVNNLAALLWDMGLYSESEPLYRRALAIREKVLGPEDPDIAQSLNNLAVLQQTLGRLSEARPLFERGLAIYEKSLGPEDLDTASNVDNLASLLRAMGNYSEARPLYERAFAIREKRLGPEDPATASSLNNLGMLLTAMGSYEEARPLFERALRTKEKALGPWHPDTAGCLNNLASLLRTIEHYDEARPLFERALAINEKALGPEHPATANSLCNLGFLLSAMGRYSQARPLYERALSIDETVLGPEHPHTAECLGDLALLHADIGEGQAAWNLASSAFERTTRNLRRAFPVLVEGERVNLCSSVFQRVETRLALELRSPEPGIRRSTYESVLTWKGQVARTALEDRERTLRALSPEKQAKIGLLRGVQAQLSAELAKAAGGDRELREKQLAELRDRRSSLERDLLGTSGSFAKAEPSLGDLIARLPSDSALVDFLAHREYVPAVIENGKTKTTGRWTEPHMTAWIVRSHRDAIDRIDLGEAKILREAIQGLLSLLESERGVSAGAAEGRNAVKTAMDRVRELLWTPIASSLGSTKRIFVSPDRFLGTFPFETLMDEDGSYLVEKFTISYASDGTTLASILDSTNEATNRQAGSLLAIGGIDYDARGKAEAGKAKDEPIAAPSVRGGFQDYWEPLRFTRKEAETVFALYESKRKKSEGVASASDDDGSLLILGSDAVEESLKRQVAGKRYIHVATHGFFQPEGLPSMWENAREKAATGGPAMSGETQRITGLLPGLLSGLVCAGANLPVEEGRDDGLLTAEEVTWLDLTNCDLLVLSACQTALGKDRAGEGMMSLQRAFQMAGAKSVISSLWNVDDERTVELMRSFYKHLWIDAQSRIDSLRNAQLEMLAKNRAERQGRGLPWTWGAFVLYGDWR